MATNPRWSPEQEWARLRLAEARLTRRDLLAKCAALGVLTVAPSLSLAAALDAWDGQEPRRPTPWNELGPRATGAIAGVSADHMLRIWDTKSGQVSRTIDVTGRDLALLAMSFDGRLLLMGDCGGRVTIWNAATGEVEWEPRVRRFPTAAAFSRDGRLLALAPGSPVQLVDLNSRQIVRELETTTGTTSVVFSRDGRLLATTDGDAVRIYDVQSGRVVARNDDFAGVQLAVEFSADGNGCWPPAAIALCYSSPRQPARRFAAPRSCQTRSSIWKHHQTVVTSRW